MNAAPIAVTALVAGLAGLLVGRALAPDEAPATPATAPASSPDAPSRALPDDVARARSAAPTEARAAAAPRGEPDARPDAPTEQPTPPPASAAVPRSVVLKSAPAGASCEDQLAIANDNVAMLDARRREHEGEPIAPRDDVAPRMHSAGLVRTFDDAFRATKIRGGVETVDCSEHPCIVFGRLQGDEAMVAELEDSKFFAQYDDDVGVMLTWASGDHEREGESKPGLEREKPPEVSLFAFSFYSHEDKQKHGEALDRRIRTRTAEYWNASRPDE